MQCIVDAMLLTLAISIQSMFQNICDTALAIPSPASWGISAVSILPREPVASALWATISLEYPDENGIPSTQSRLQCFPLNNQPRGPQRKLQVPLNLDPKQGVEE